MRLTWHFESSLSENFRPSQDNPFSLDAMLNELDLCIRFRLPLMQLLLPLPLLAQLLQLSASSLSSSARLLHPKHRLSRRGPTDRTRFRLLRFRELFFLSCESGGFFLREELLGMNLISAAWSPGLSR